MTDELRDKVAEAIFAVAYQERWKEFWKEESLRTGFYEMADAAIAAMKPKDGLTWQVSQEEDGQWSASVVDGTYGWAMHKNMDLAKSKAALRLHAARYEAEYTERSRAEIERKRAGMMTESNSPTRE